MTRLIINNLVRHISVVVTQCDHWREVKTLLQHTMTLQTADSAQDSGKGLVMLISHPEINLNLAQKQHLLSGLQDLLFPCSLNI